jgi:hypothetical protein
MLPARVKLVRNRWILPDPIQTWIILEEQRIHSRIADLVIVRLDIQALEMRRDGGWLRPLRLAEVRVIAELRNDRATSPATIAQKTGLNHRTYFAYYAAWPLTDSWRARATAIGASRPEPHSRSVSCHSRRSGRSLAGRCCRPGPTRPTSRSIRIRGAVLHPV